MAMPANQNKQETTEKYQYEKCQECQLLKRLTDKPIQSKETNKHKQTGKNEASKGRKKGRKKERKKERRTNKRNERTKNQPCHTTNHSTNRATKQPASNSHQTTAAPNATIQQQKLAR